MDISVPAAEEGKEKESRSVGEIIINIKIEGEIIVNGQQLSEDDLLTKLKNIVTVYKDQAVILRGDEGVDYKHVIRVLDTCQKAGIWNIAFATRRPEASAATKNP